MTGRKTFKAGAAKVSSLLSQSLTHVLNLSKILPASITVRAIRPAREFTRCFIAIFLLAFSSFLLFAPSALAAGVTTRVNVDSSGVEANGSSYDIFKPAMSADGRYVAFSSSATNLVAGGTNGLQHIFVRDRQTGTTTLVSKSSAGIQGDNTSSYPSMSADGRYVAFESRASTFVAGTVFTNIFVHDRQTGTTTLASPVLPGGFQTDSGTHPSISGDGRYVAFSSGNTGLVTGDTNGIDDVFVRDRTLGVTTLISRDSAGNIGSSAGWTWGSLFPSISGDGRYVAFESEASNLVPGDINGLRDIFVRDLQTGVTTRVSVDSAGAEANGNSQRASISADGRYVAFASDATNLVAGDTNGASDIFVHDRLTHVTTRVSVGPSGLEANGTSGFPAISADGNYVTFYSQANNTVVPSPGQGVWDIFVHDRTLGATSIVSVDNAGNRGNGYSMYSSISGDGRYTGFLSVASNLVAGDTNGQWDVFVHEKGTTPVLPPPPGATTSVSPSGVITDTTPTYRWNAVAGATSYQLLVKNAAGTARINASYTATAAGCPAGTGICSITPATILAVGAHNWWIRAGNSGGWGAFSVAKSFYVATTVPGKATLSTPYGAITTARPTYRWYAVPGATKYALLVRNPGTTVKVSLLYTSTQTGCAKGVGACYITPATALVAGTGSWSIHAWNPLGYGAWSAAKTFTKQ